MQTGYFRFGEKQRIAVYRSRSASRMLFEELKTAPSGTRPAWFDFEKDCAQIIGKRGWEVFNQAASRDGDGGVDLFSSVGDCDYVVQCKCWSHPVGPEVIRELHGAIALAKGQSGRETKGIVMTTSTFTSGAVSTATEFDYEVINGEKMDKLLRTAE